MLDSWSGGSNRGKGRNVHVSSHRKRTHRARQNRQSAGEENIYSVRLKVTVKRVIPAVFQFDDEAFLLLEACSHGPPSSCCDHTPAEGAGHPCSLVEGEVGALAGWRLSETTRD